LRVRGGNSLIESLKSEKQLKIALLLILCLSLFINTYSIGWGLPSFNAWAADELIPSRVLKGIEKGFVNGWHFKYPPLHFYILTILYAPILLLDHLKLIDVNSLSGYTILFYIGRFFSVIQATALVFIVYLCGKELYEKRAAVFAALITALLCPLVYYAKTINLEAPYLFWVMLSILFYIRIFKSQKLADYLLFATAATLAVCTKDQAYGLYILTPLFIIYQNYRYLKEKNKEITLKDAIYDEKILLSLALGVTLFLTIHNVVFNLGGFISHVNLIVSGDAKIRPRFERNLVGYFSMFVQSFRHIRFSFGWPMYCLCMLGLFNAFLKKSKPYLLYYLLIPIISYYLFYISVVFYNNVRYLLPSCLILALYGGKFISELLNPAQKFFKAKAVLITAIFVYTFAYSFSVNILMENDSRYYVEKWMEQNISRTAFILGAGDRKYLPRLENYQSEITREPTLEVLARTNPDYIIGTSGYDIRRFDNNRPEYEFFDKLNRGELGYQLLLTYQSNPQWDLFNHEEIRTRDLDRMYIYSNFDKINPEIRVFGKKK
jgi:4-amino-4-deoxy-L-arabinose transferase-like glycosyltransferase